MSEAITAKDLRGNSPEELQSTIRKLREDLFKNRMKRVTNQLENTMLIRHARRDIARVNTVLAEKLRAAAPAVPAPEGAQKSKSKAMSSSKAKEK